jgi:hypothetical protein
VRDEDAADCMTDVLAAEATDALLALVVEADDVVEEDLARVLRVVRVAEEDEAADVIDWIDFEDGVGATLLLETEDADVVATAAAVLAADEVTAAEVLVEEAEDELTTAELLAEEAAAVDEAAALATELVVDDPEDDPPGPDTLKVTSPLSIYTPETCQSSVTSVVDASSRTPTCQSAPLELALTLTAGTVNFRSSAPVEW